jgi:protein-S-isoprenylcysteine O-methyltransferase Ste14
MTRGSSRWSEFRARGGLWVVAQSALFAAIAAASILGPRWPDEVRFPLSVVGGVLAGAGLGFAVWAYRSLGSSFTAYPRPPSGANRVDTGPYRYVRHPMYGGLLLFLAGISLAYSVTALAFTAALAALWRAKSAGEERFLLARFPDDYAAYRQRTRHRFWPYVY